MAYHGGSSSAHIGGALSLAEIVTVIFGSVANFKRIIRILETHLF